MESMNKFKVLTIIGVCMFVFMVAAIYSNTKDATINNSKPQASTANKVKAPVVRDTANVQELQNQIEMLTRRIDELQNNSAGELTCKIVGVSTSEGIYKLTQEEAIEEAKNSGSEIVINCSF